MKKKQIEKELTPEERDLILKQKADLAIAIECEHSDLPRYLKDRHIARLRQDGYLRNHATYMDDFLPPYTLSRD